MRKRETFFFFYLLKNLLIYFSNAILYKTSRVVKSTKALKLGLRDESRQVLQTLTPESGARDKQGGELGGLERPYLETAVPTSPVSSPRSDGPELSDLISSKDGRNVEFLVYKYQKLHV